MPFGWIAAATIGAGLIGAGAAESAAGTQAAAANRATDTQLGMFNTINQQQAPYRQAGYTALSALLRGSGLPGGTGTAPTRDQFTTTTPGAPGAQIFRPQFGYQPGPAGAPTTSFDQPGFDKATAGFNASQNAPLTGGMDLMRPFTAADLQTNLAPNYEFMKQQGLGATENMLNASGGNISGNTMRGMTKFAEDYAGTGYQNAFQNYQTNQTNIFNRLAAIAGGGQTANQTSAQAGTTISGNAAQSMMSAGASQAAGTVGAANAIGGAATNAASWYSMPQIINAFKGNSVNV